MGRGQILFAMLDKLPSPVRLLVVICIVASLGLSVWVTAEKIGYLEAGLIYGFFFGCFGLVSFIENFHDKKWDKCIDEINSRARSRRNTG